MNEIINKVCKHLPDDFEIVLRMERGAAWIEMYDDYHSVELGDPTDKTLTEQLNDALCDALCIANGWGSE